MNIKEIERLTSFIAGKRQSVDSISKFLILHTFKNYSPRAIYVGQVETDGYLSMKSSFGFDPGYINQWDRISLTSNIPIIDSIRKDEVLIFSSRQTVIDLYPEIGNLGILNINWNSCFTSPIQSTGAYMVIFDGKLESTLEFLYFLKSIGNLLALHLEEVSQVRKDKYGVPEEVKTLTVRQEIIKTFLGKGFTNAHIAQEIGYSESLVRQETIAIYAALHISGRTEIIDAAVNETI